MKYFLFIVILSALIVGCAKDKFFHPACLGKTCRTDAGLQSLFNYKIYDDGRCAAIDKCYGESIPKKWEEEPFDKSGVHLSFLEYQENATSSLSSQREIVTRSLDESNQNKNPVYLIVYVHGWHNNACRYYANDINKDINLSCDEADEDTDDVKGFEALLMKSAYELRKAGKSYNVLGVYVGWRGESIDIPVLNQITIGDRATAADGIARTSGLRGDLEALDTLISQQKESRMLVIGHSLGGRILSRAFIENPKHYNGGCYRALGEQTYFVTLNPAIEAVPFSHILSSLQGSTCDAYPHWINITSVDDWTTRFLFPVGALIGASDNIRANGGLTTIGHYDSYITHYLEVPFIGGSVNECKSTKSRNLKEIQKLFDLSSKSESEAMLKYDLSSECLYKPKITVKQCPKPIWNISTNKDVIDSNSWTGVHSAFVQTNLFILLHALVFHEI